MERLLVAKLEVNDCEAELRLNGIPLARADAARPRVVVPVHEYTIAGANRLELVLWPPPATPPAEAPPPSVAGRASGQQSAHARILLPRVGSPISESSARTLAQIDWAPAAGSAYEAPLALSEELSLPVSFPRWRWLDAPPIDLTPALQAQVLALLQSYAQDLAAGEPERFLTGVRLRTEEIAVAYQRRPEEETARLREHLAAAHAAGRLKWLPLAADTLALRPVAGGRLLECLGASGGPALSTEPDERGQTLALPLRLAAVEGRLYVLR